MLLLHHVCVDERMAGLTASSQQAMADACQCIASYMLNFAFSYSMQLLCTHYSINIFSMSIYQVVTYLHLYNTIIAILSDARSDDDHNFM